jgi:hypothetical protein
MVAQMAGNGRPLARRMPDDFKKSPKPFAESLDALSTA